MARRSRILAGVVFVVCAAALSGCSGAGTGAGGDYEPSSGVGVQGGAGVQDLGNPGGVGNQAGLSSQAAGSQAVSSITIASKNGNAKIADPISGGFPKDKGTVAPATPDQPDPNAIPETFYTFGPTVSLADNSPASSYPITIKYDPAKLPKGVSPGQLGIVEYEEAGLPPNYEYLGGTVNTSKHTVGIRVNYTGTYGVGVAVPFAGNFSGRYSGTKSGAMLIGIGLYGVGVGSGANRGSDGVTTGALVDIGGNSYDISGWTTYTGAISFHASVGDPAVATTFTGALQKAGSDVSGSGTWNDSAGGSGSWTIP